MPQLFDVIELADMKAEIDLGEIILHDNEKSARDTALWLTQRFFWDHPIHKETKISQAAMKIALSQAKYLAAQYLFNEWGDLGDRAKIFLLSDANHTGWHTNEYFNYKSLEELLANTLSEQDTSVGISTYSFMVNELLPAAELLGVEPHLLYGAATQVKKMRELVPTARKILHTEGMSDAMKQQYLKHFIQKAADPEVKYSEFYKDTSEFRGKTERKFEKIPGYECIMPNGETWIVVRCPRPIDERVVEMLLGKKVELRVTEWTAFTSLLAGMMKAYQDEGLDDPEQLIPRLIRVLNGKAGERKHAKRKPAQEEGPTDQVSLAGVL